jgi:hypothetical protein
VNNMQGIQGGEMEVIRADGIKETQLVLFPLYCGRCGEQVEPDSYGVLVGSDGTVLCGNQIGRAQYVHKDPAVKP